MARVGPQRHKKKIKEANSIWRIKTNKEMDELIKHRNIINYVKLC